MFQSCHKGNQLELWEQWRKIEWLHTLNYYSADEYAKTGRGASRKGPPQQLWFSFLCIKSISSFIPEEERKINKYRSSLLFYMGSFPPLLIRLLSSPLAKNIQHSNSYTEYGWRSMLLLFIFMQSVKNYQSKDGVLIKIKKRFIQGSLMKDPSS